MVTTICHHHSPFTAYRMGEWYFARYQQWDGFRQRSGVWGLWKQDFKHSQRNANDAEMSSMRVLVSVSPWLNGSKPGGASLCIGVIRLRGVTPPPRPIGRCRCIGRRIVRSRIGSGIIRSSQRTGDDPTDDRGCPPTTAVPTAAMTPTAAAMMTLRVRYTGGANHDSSAQSDDSIFHCGNVSI